MTKKKAALSIACIMFIFGFFISGLVVHAATIEIRVGNHDTEKHPMFQKGFLPWSAEIEKRTKGQVKFKWYHGGSLVKANQLHEAVKNGVIDMAMFVPVWAQESKFPVTRSFNLPFLFESGIQANLTTYKILTTVPEYKKEFDGLKILAVHNIDALNLHLVVPGPKKMEDMKGLPLFGGSKTAVQIIQLLGGAPRAIKAEDVTMSLQRGDIKGVLFPTTPLAAFKLTDMVNHHVIIRAASAVQPTAMNLDKWNSLPPDVQKVFEELAPSLTILLGTLVDEGRESILSQLKKRGDDIYILPPEEKARWRKAVQPITDEWLQEMQAKGINGQKLYSNINMLAKENQHPQIKPAAWWPANWKREEIK